MDDIGSSRAGSLITGLKWLVIVMIGAVIVAGNYYYADFSLFYRVVVALLLLAVAGLIFYTTEEGKRTVQLMIQARLEIGRVVWPTRPEMAQTFIAVMLMVALAMLILWALDSLFAWGAATILG